MTYIQQWYEQLIGAKPHQLSRSLRVEGVCDRHLGPKWAFVRVVCDVEPSNQFHMDVSYVDCSNQPELQNRGYLTAFAFGFLDVAMTATDGPHTALTLVIREVDVDPVSTSLMAFRMAGQKSAEEFLRMLHSSST